MEDEFLLVDPPDLNDRYQFLWDKKITEKEYEQQFLSEYNKDPNLLLRILFFVRNCRGGMGNRFSFRKGIFLLIKIDPDCVYRNLKNIPIVGYWKDLWMLWPQCNEYLKSGIIELCVEQLKKDIISLGMLQEISMAAKWMPNEKSELDRKYKITKLLCAELKWSLKEYRKRIGTMRRAIVEQKKLFFYEKTGIINIIDGVYLNIN